LEDDDRLGFDHLQIQDGLNHLNVNLDQEYPDLRFFLNQTRSHDRREFGVYELLDLL
jgi:hypothetical protein